MPNGNYWHVETYGYCVKSPIIAQARIAVGQMGRNVKFPTHIDSIIQSIQ